MPRHWKIAIAILGGLVLVGVLSFPGLMHSVFRLQHSTVQEEQARREITHPPISTPTDVLAKAQMFWISPTMPTMLEATEIELPLSADPVQRAKQLIDALITKVPTPAQRTLPADAELIEFYLLPDGTAVADFSGALTTQMPSGILSEQLAVESIVRTLGANMTGVQRLKILISGQQVDTLAGHVDLTGFFPVGPAATPTSTSAGTQAPSNPATSSGGTAAAGSANSAKPAGRTASTNSLPVH